MHTQKYKTRQAHLLQLALPSLLLLQRTQQCKVTLLRRRHVAPQRTLSTVSRLFCGGHDGAVHPLQHKAAVVGVLSALGLRDARLCLCMRECMCLRVSVYVCVCVCVYVCICVCACKYMSVSACVCMRVCI